jgi:hypothetical protein
MVDWLMADYGESRESAFGTFPMAAAIVLWPAAVERKGGEPTGPDAATRAFLRSMGERDEEHLKDGRDEN